MMEHKVTYRSETHNFWRTYNKKQPLYQITKKGEPMPHTGYYYPEHLLSIKGYSHLNVEETFDMVGKQVLRLSKYEKIKANSLKKAK